MKRQRRIRRTAGPAMAGWRGSASRFFNSFRPSQFKDYWLSRDGLRRIGKIAGTGFLLIFLLFLWFAKDLPSPGKVNARVGAQTTKFYDRDEKKILYEVFGDKNRSVIEFEQMPDNIKEATIAIEDKDFYKHGAFSSVGIVRAAFVNLFRPETGIQGGSTITQQYVKNALLSSERTFSRKIKELILSIEIEAFYSKNDILRLYLNEIPYGTNSYGIKAAAKTYFDKENPKDLTLDEAALLAAIPRAPTYYSPYGQHTDDLVARKGLILDLMAEQGYVTKSEAEEAKKTDTLGKIRPVQNLYANITAPHFVLYAQELLEAKFGNKYVTEGGLKVITTLDLDKQEASEAAIARGMPGIRANGGSNAAMVSADPKTGQIYSMVGSYKFDDPKFGAVNVATSDRQPGSSFKPFAYATAFGKNHGPGTTLYDVTTDFGGGYKPENYTDQTYGVQSMRTALAGSLNITSVKTLYLAGIPDTLKTAHEMGITTLKGNPSQYGLSLVLGSGEVKLVDMVNAYQSFANGGVHYQPTAILKATDPKGKVIQEYKPDKNPEQVLDPQVAYLISDVLSDNGARAYIFGNALTLPGGRKAAVKTGTTENYRDAWTVGYTPSLVAGVWAGNNDNKPMTRAASAIAAPIWRDFMTKTLSSTRNEEFTRPAGIKQMTLDANTGKLAGPGAKKTRTDIFASGYKPAAISTSRSAKVDKVSGKLATECTPPLAIETAYSSEMHAEIPPTDPAYARWEPPVRGLASRMGYGAGGTLPTENDDKHSCSDDKPRISLTADARGGGRYNIKAVVTSGTFTANKLEIRLDDQIISTKDLNGSDTYQFDHTITTLGSHTIKGTVTDTGLYSDEDSKTVNVTSLDDGGSFTGLSPGDGTIYNSKPVEITFTWGSRAGANRYQLWLRRSGTPFTKVGSDTTGTSLKHTIALPGDYDWYVRAIDAGGNEIDRTRSLDFEVK
ncbi:MAG TPA: transglycosylase domain-containing protein [Candidatus Saccharimonadales bacterium]|nr:transglycosylase domain-containing protein [Candidatus Saccharimonadales bacterium]